MLMYFVCHGSSVYNRKGIRGSMPIRSLGFYLPYLIQKGCGPTQPPIQRIPGSNTLERKCNDLIRQPRVRMPPLPLYAFSANQTRSPKCDSYISYEVFYFVLKCACMKTNRKWAEH
jgi:hypothetical protein